MRKFEWDGDKAAANRRKHRVSFEAATLVFDDPLKLTVLDDRFDYGETREITIGRVQDRVLAVIHTDREGKTRIISARRASPSEVRAYCQVHPGSG
jgi:uncharacterized DUF497 family protein